jgi:CDP-diacylglycerol--glycerol-3-phosphate 3-phosphatidyltransferase
MVEQKGAVVNWPNWLSGTRLAFSPVLVILAMQRLPVALTVLAAVLVLTDWLDGLLARWLRQHTIFGARLDTLADATFYGCALIATTIVDWRLIAGEAGWIAVAVGSYALSWILCLTKFGRMPSYHTWAAKAAWVWVGVGIVCLFAGWSAWPLRIAMVAVTMTNVEAIAITLALREPQVNVATIWHLLCRQTKNDDEAFQPDNQTRPR